MARVFISKPDSGWQEVKIPENYKKYSYDALISIAHKFVGRTKHKGLFITENPNPFQVKVSKCVMQKE